MITIKSHLNSIIIKYYFNVYKKKKLSYFLVSFFSSFIVLDNFPVLKNLILVESEEKDSPFKNIIKHDMRLLSPMPDGVGDI